MRSPEPTSSPLPNPADFRAQIEGLRSYLLRYATLQLRDAAAAEDAVQDTLLAALAGEAGFTGRSNLRTWLTGILKHKIVDAIRRQSRDRPATEQELDGGDEEFDGLFDRRGHWEEAPGAWDQPASSLQQKQFLTALEACLRDLPERTARVFMMREHLGLLSQGEDRKLAFGERVALRVHLAICNGCRNVNAQFKFLHLAMKNLTRDGNEERPG